MKKPSSGYVYVASIENEPNLCKIGYTKKDPKVRVSNLKRDYPGYEFELYDSYETNQPLKSERSAHSVLYYARVEREIFNVTPCEARVAVLRGLNKNFECIEYSDEMEVFCKDWIVNSMGLTYLDGLSFGYYLPIINLCIELYNLSGSDSIYSVSKNMIESVTSELDISKMMEGCA